MNEFSAIRNHAKEFERQQKQPHYGIMDITNPDENCLSYWFPKIQAAGLPVPETRYIALNHTGTALSLIHI